MYFYLWKSANDNQWYFVLRALNHQTIVTSEGYASKQAAKNGIALVQSSSHAPTYEAS